MRAEKEYLVQETEKHLEKSSYVLLADFQRVTVGEIAKLREDLAKEGAEFHVVKNRIFRIAAKKQGLPEFEADTLTGHTAIIVGGENPSAVAKVLKAFQKKDTKVEKGSFKAGVLENALMNPAEVTALADLPSKEVLRGQLLGLFNAPAESLLRTLNAASTSFLNVLQAKADKEN